MASALTNSRRESRQPIGSRADPLSLLVCSRDVPGAQLEGALVISAMEKLGHRVARISNEAIDPQGVDAILILGNANWFPQVLKGLRRIPRNRRPLTGIWHWEPLPPPARSALRWPWLSAREAAKIVLQDPRTTDIYSNYYRLRVLTRDGLPGVLAVSTRSRAEFLEERGIAAHHIPLGYCSGYGTDLGLERDIEVLFLGEKRISRRKRLLRHLRSAGIPVLAQGDWKDAQYWGEQRTRLLNRTRILVNLQRFPREFSGVRLILGMANKALVISEPMYRPDPFVAGKHFVSAEGPEMPSVIRRYLRDAAARSRIVEDAHQFVTAELTLESSVARFISMLRARLRSAS